MINKRLLIAFVFISGLLGCVNYDKKADQLNAKHLQQMEQIATYVDRIIAEASLTDFYIEQATTQPVSPTVKQSLITAHIHAQATTRAAYRVYPATRAAQDTSNRETTNAHNAAGALAAEQDHWLGYKSRVTLWIIGGLAAVGVISYFIITGGGTAVLAIISPLFSGLLSVLSKAAIGLGHILTLGLSYIALKVRNKNNVKPEQAPPTGPTT